MCGIFALLNYNKTKLDTNLIGNQAQKGQHRGPDSYKIDINNIETALLYTDKIDVNSGLETKKGIKDPEKIKLFFNLLNNYEN